MFKQLFRSMKMTSSGRVVHKEDVQIEGSLGTVSLLLKKNRASEKYVILTVRSPGNLLKIPMELDEFSEFTKAVHAVNTISHS
jgi:hypothetical protein